MVDEKKEEPHGLIKRAIFLGIIVAFATSIYLLFEDMTASATVAAAFTLALLLFHYIPIVESFEVFGLKAKLRHGVEEMNRLLGGITKTAEVSSKLLYVQLAWMNRMGSISWTKKRELLSDIDGLLDSVGVSEQEIADLKQPFLVMISRDMLSIFENMLRFRVNHYSKLLQQEYDEAFKGKAIDMSDPIYKDIRERQQRWSFTHYNFDDILSDTRLLDLDKLTQDVILPHPFPNDDLANIENIRIKVVKLATDCWNQGTITPGAEEFLKAYNSPQDKLHNEVFKDVE